MNLKKEKKKNIIWFALMVAEQVAIMVVVTKFAIEAFTYEAILEQIYIVLVGLAFLAAFTFLWEKGWPFGGQLSEEELRFRRQIPILWQGAFCAVAIVAILTYFSVG